MSYTFSLLDEQDAREVQQWRYENPYEVYNLAADDLDHPDELLDRRSPHYAVNDQEGNLIGFFSFGTSALVEGEVTPSLYIENKTLPVGLGMRPDLTGQGQGLAFVQAGLAFARREFQPRRFVLYVYPWNKRAIRVYERAGFQRVRLLTVHNIHGESIFLEMERSG